MHPTVFAVISTRIPDVACEYFHFSIEFDLSYFVIVVGLSVTQQPPHRFRRAELLHRALQKYSLPASAYVAEGMALWGLYKIRARSIWNSLSILNALQL
jgi:hypothetical protein